MSNVDRERWRVLDPLLDRAWELSTVGRGEWMAGLRAESPLLAADLDALLEDDAAANERGFLAEPPVTPRASLAGLRLGPYTVERPLGHGGMGSVWLARRDDGHVDGQAAVKFLNLSLLGDTGRERFRREGAVLARLAHPGIARLHDAGVAANGRPYLVLEYVHGTPIDAFADARRLDVVGRVRLVLQVLSAVEHAHTRLVVHRDLKPTNILVTGDGTAKLLDFGIAKLLADDSGEHTALTAEGCRALTPAYAAPEQLFGEAVTAATDVYAAGVLLYRLLTGTPPIDVAGRSFVEIVHLVGAVEPARPSATFAPGTADRQARAQARGDTPDHLRRQLRGDLDAIVLRALHKEPRRRYPSAAALAEDLERLLAGRPIRTRPDNVLYRLRRLVRRHHRSVAVTATATLVGSR